MREYGGIEIPLKKVEKIHLSSNMDAIDFLLDLDMGDKFNFIATVYNNNLVSFKVKNVLFYYRVNGIYMSYRAVILLVRTPDPALIEFEGQKYLIIVAQNLEKLQRYLLVWRASCGDVKEAQAVHILIQAIEYSIQIQSNQKLTY